MSKFACPKCSYPATDITAVTGQREITRYRHCRMCNANYATIETLKDTPRVRSWLGEALSAKYFKPKPFKYRTIKQQKRAVKSSA